MVIAGYFLMRSRNVEPVVQLAAPEERGQGSLLGPEAELRRAFARGRDRHQRLLLPARVQTPDDSVYWVLTRGR